MRVLNSQRTYLPCPFAPPRVVGAVGEADAWRALLPSSTCPLCGLRRGARRRAGVPLKKHEKPHQRDRIHRMSCVCGDCLPRNIPAVLFETNKRSLFLCRDVTGGADAREHTSLSTRSMRYRATATPGRGTVADRGRHTASERVQQRLRISTSKVCALQDLWARKDRETHSIQG